MYHLRSADVNTEQRAQGLYSRIKTTYAQMGTWSHDVLEGHFDILDNDGHVVSPEDYEEIVEPGMMFSVELWRKGHFEPVLDHSDYLSRTSGKEAVSRIDGLQSLYPWPYLPQSPPPPPPPPPPFTPEQLAQMKLQLPKTQDASSPAGKQMQRDSDHVSSRPDQARYITTAPQRPAIAFPTSSMNPRLNGRGGMNRDSAAGGSIIFNPSTALHMRGTTVDPSWESTGHQATIDSGKGEQQNKVEQEMRKRLAEHGFRDNQVQAHITLETQKEAKPAVSAPMKPLYIIRIDLEDIAVETLLYYDIPFETGAVSHHGQLGYHTLPLIVCDRNRISDLFWWSSIVARWTY
jgi:hypothetical protein